MFSSIIIFKLLLILGQKIANKLLLTYVNSCLALALARFGHFRTICEMFERSLRYAPKEEHIWSQFALSLGIYICWCNS